MEWWIFRNHFNSISCYLHAITTCESKCVPLESDLRLLMDWSSISRCLWNSSCGDLTHSWVRRVAMDIVATVSQFQLLARRDLCMRENSRWKRRCTCDTPSHFIIIADLNFVEVDLCTSIITLQVKDHFKLGFTRECSSLQQRCWFSWLNLN